MATKSKNKGEYGAFVALGTDTTAGRKALTSSSAAFTSGRFAIGSVYKFSLDPASSSAAWVQTGGTATLPADDAAFTAGFWLMPGESEVIDATAVQYSAILVSGTGTLYATKLST